MSIVERLRKHPDEIMGPICETEYAKVIAEAADHIESLQSERDELAITVVQSGISNGALGAEIDILRARIAQLEAEPTEAMIDAGARHIWAETQRAAFGDESRHWGIYPENGCDLLNAQAIASYKTMQQARESE